MRRFRSRAELRAIFAKLHQEVVGTRTATAPEPATDTRGRPLRSEKEWAALDGETWDREVERLGYERARFVDRDGNPLLEKSTYNALSVGFSPEEMALLRKRAVGATMTHNHPNGSSFSMADYEFAESVNLRETRVIGRSGVQYSLRLKDANTYWPKMTETEQSDYRLALGGSRLRVKQAGTVKVVEHESEHGLHNFWTQWARKYKDTLTYTRTGTWDSGKWADYWLERRENA